MTNTTFDIIDKGDTCALRSTEIHLTCNLPLPIPAADALALIDEAVKTGTPQSPRVSRGPVHADLAESGVTIEYRRSKFDVPWLKIVRGIPVTEAA